MKLMDKAECKSEKCWNVSLLYVNKNKCWKMKMNHILIRQITPKDSIFIFINDTFYKNPRKKLQTQSKNPEN